MISCKQGLTLNKMATIIRKIQSLYTTRIPNGPRFRSTLGTPRPTTSRSRRRCSRAPSATRRWVMFRRKDGSVAALEDACWHRLLPLSQGHAARRPDHLRLPRTGVQRRRALHPHAFAGDDQSVGLRARLSGGTEAPLHLGLATATRHSPTESKIPDLHWNDHPEWAGDGKLIRVNCDYRLVLDNLMDLTHETFVHGSSIGQRAVAEAPFVATHGDRTATVTRWMEAHRCAPVLGRADPLRARLRRQGGPLADHPLRSAVHHHHRRGRGAPQAVARRRASARAVSTALC